MIVKVKKQTILSATPLNADNKIYSTYIMRNGVKNIFDIVDDVIQVKLYQFETISNVVNEIASTSKSSRTEHDTTNGIFTVYSEGNTPKSYAYFIEPISYLNGLPIMTSVKANGVDCKIVDTPTPTTIRNTTFNLGIIAKNDITQEIDIINVQDGGWKTLSIESDFGTIEKEYLYDGVSKFLKIWRTSDELSTEVGKFIYYKIITNDQLFIESPIVTDTKIPYESMIGLYNFDVFVPLFKGIDLVEVYKQDTKTDLVTYLTDNDILNYIVPFTELDLDFSEIFIDENLHWNDSIDSGFVVEDILGMSKTFADKMLEILDRLFVPAWDENKLTITFNNIESEIEAKVEFRKRFFEINKTYNIYEWFKNVSNEYYNENLLEKFKEEFTFSFLSLYLTESDANFFKNRFEYMSNIFDSYKSDLAKYEVELFTNIFITLENNIRMSKLANYQSTSNGNLSMSIELLSEKSHLMFLANPFN